ncbi:hypothetical protein COLO4_29631 [Corchorus olitorius]|uniref:Neprosin PEP catalytic domain-containing protein n=1 Tax=Corchorus olitorius TaxID=93759 RepID=A0A1R3HDS4_9ROSI|nr:hypothetical protein COLO4_29631 [Corchorus olitorius]
MSNWITYIGYWPKELLPKLSKGANHVAWGGIAIADKQGNSPPMGSGHMPNDDYKRCCYFKYIKFLNNERQFLTPDDNAIIRHVDKSGCYGRVDKRHCGKLKVPYCIIFGRPVENVDD